MTVVVGAEYSLLLGTIEVLVHGDSPDVLLRPFVTHDEVIGVFVFQSVVHERQHTTVIDGSLPGVHGLVVDLELHVGTVGAHAVGPVVVAIDLRIEHQLGKHEIGHRLCDSAIIVACFITVFIREVGQGSLQLVDAEVKHLLAFGLLHIVHRDIVNDNDGHVGKEVEQIPVVDGSEGTYLGDVFIIAGLRD